MLKVTPSTIPITFRSWNNYNPFHYATLSTESSVVDQLWSLLDMVIEVTHYRKNLLIQNGLSESDIKKVSPVFQSFLRQAKRYWEAAQAVDSPSNALLYYYSFLNLIKAFLSSKNLIIITSDVRHGLSTKNDFSRGSILSKSVTIQGHSTKNVFSNYHATVFKTNHLNGKTHHITLKELFKYCENIGMESSSVINNGISLSHFKLICDHKSNTKYRHVFNVDGGFKLSKIITAKKFIRVFNKHEYRHIAIDIEKAFPAIHTSNIDLYVGPEFDPEKEQENSDLFFNAFKQYIGESYTPDLSTGIIYLPARAKLNNKLVNIPISQDQAIYLVMFFLSEMVRYRPNYLDFISESKEYWLFNVFLNNCPNLFLKAITNKILNQNFIIKA